MTRQQDEMNYRSKFEPTFQLDYPVRLVASLAVQILGQNIKLGDDQAFRDAVRCACKLIDACHEESAQHYIEVNGLVPLRRDEPRFSFTEAVRQIVGRNRFKNRLKDAIRDFEKYFVTQIDMFYEVTDDDKVAIADPKSAAYGRMLTALTAYEERGITSSEVDELQKGYTDWKKRDILASRAMAGTKGGIEKAKKQQPKHAKTGKFKKKEKFFLDPQERELLDAKVAKLANKKAKRPPH